MAIYTVTTDYACFGIVTRKGIVVEAAPIGRWMRGKSIETVRNWVRDQRFGSIRKVEPKKKRRRKR